MNMRNRELHDGAAEHSPLLINQSSSLGGEDANPTTDLSSRTSDEDALSLSSTTACERPRGQASVTQTVVNLAKTCAGTGILALPYACNQGGLVVFVLGLLLIAVWNVYCVERLVLCLKMVHTTAGGGDGQHDIDTLPTTTDSNEQETRQHSASSPSPPTNASTLSKVAFAAWGPLGHQLVDAMMVILLLGIIVAYVSGVVSFLSDTPLTGGPLADALIVASIMALLAMVPDLGYLSGASVVGLLALLGTFVVTTGYGLSQHTQNSTLTTTATYHNHLWPVSLHGLSRFFGVSVYGYGVVPLTYNFRASMKEPNRLVEATRVALSLVAVAYCAVGVGLLELFPHVTGQVLHELPNQGIVPTLVRVAMALVCIVTAPLIIVPAGELLESKLHVVSPVVIRCGVCLVAAVAAVLLPTFVQVLSVVGCLCVGTVGFCLPPLLHLRLVRIRGIMTSQGVLWTDRCLFALGLFATIVGTLFTI